MLPFTGEEASSSSLSSSASTVIFGNSSSVNGSVSISGGRNDGDSDSSTGNSTSTSSDTWNRSSSSSPSSSPSSSLLGYTLSENGNQHVRSERKKKKLTSTTSSCQSIICIIAACSFAKSTVAFSSMNSPWSQQQLQLQVHQRQYDRIHDHIHHHVSRRSSSPSSSYSSTTSSQLNLYPSSLSFVITPPERRQGTTIHSHHHDHPYSSLFHHRQNHNQNNNPFIQNYNQYQPQRQHRQLQFQLFAETQEASSSSSRRSRSNDAEWDALIAAFKMYRAAYGDLKVPSRFVVPSMHPWPESGWGLKLGQRVAAIRSTGKYVDGDDERRKTLDQLGFLWRLRAPSPDKSSVDDVSFDQIYDALCTYRKEVQNDDKSLIVPANFIVPNYDPWPEATRGMPLGKRVPSVRTKAYLKANPGATEKLKSIGFEFDGKVAANDAKFNNVYNALVRYKDLNGDLLVPQPFVVPEESTDWPEEAWGLRLGARVNAIRSQGTFVKTNPARKDLLNELGFEWELPSRGKKRGRKKKAEIEALAGPAPPGLLDGDGIAAASGGSEPAVASDKQANSAEVRAPESSSLSSRMLNEEAFLDDKPDAPVWGFEDEEAEQKAMQQAPEDEFEPPKNLNTTLTEAAAMALEVGVIESLGEGKRVVKGAIHKKIPWFNDDFGEDFVFEDVVEALEIYQSIYSSFDSLHDDIEFVVPEPSFGNDIDVAASAAAAEAIANAERMGEDSDALINAEIERLELELSSSINGDDIEELASDISSTVNNDVKWPEHLAGMKLGTITKRICDGSLEVKHLPQRKKALDAIGFDWGDERKFIDVPFEKAMCAMFAYFLVRGDLFVYEDFIMPGEKPWPKALAGYELGKAVVRIRELQNFFEAYHPEKVRLLRRVEFVWFPELALPLNPEDGDESWEDTFVEGVGHPFFQLNEPSVSTLERLQSEGPSGPEEKSKSWYDYNEVADFWERGDVTDVGKESERPNWRPAEWLWFNGFEQLAEEHEERYGMSPGLELLRLIEELHEGNISEKEFDDRGKSALLRWEEEQLKNDAISAGIEVERNDSMASLIEKIKDDPQFLALDDDPEYKRLIEAELDADEAREALMRKMDMEEMGIEEEDLEYDDDDVDYEEFEEEEEEELEEVEEEAYLEDKVDDDEEEEEEVDLEEEEDDFEIEEEEI